MIDDFRACRLRIVTAAPVKHADSPSGLDGYRDEAQVVPAGGVAHGDEAELQLRIDPHRVKEAAAPAEVLPVAVGARRIAVAAKPSEADIEFASAGGDLLHSNDRPFREDAGMSARVEVEVDETCCVIDGPNQAAVRSALDAKTR